MEAISGIKIFECGELEWFAAASAEDALKAMVEEWGGSDSTAQDMRDEYLDGEDPIELSDAGLDAMTYFDTDENGDPMSRRSFRAELDRRIAAGVEFPEHFASGNM